MRLIYNTFVKPYLRSRLVIAYEMFGLSFRESIEAAKKVNTTYNRKGVFCWSSSDIKVNHAHKTTYLHITSTM